MHALIIEDEILISMIIEECLTDLGYTTFANATSERGAIEEARKCCPDFITSDARLVSGTGMEAVSQICSTNPAPVLFVVGNGDDLGEIVKHAVVLEKPFTASQFSSAVASAIASFDQVRITL